MPLWRAIVILNHRLALNRRHGRRREKYSIGAVILPGHSYGVRVRKRRHGSRRGSIKYTCKRQAHFVPYQAARSSHSLHDEDRRNNTCEGAKLSASLPAYDDFAVLYELDRKRRHAMKRFIVKKLMSDRFHAIGYYKSVSAINREYHDKPPLK